MTLSTAQANEMMLQAVPRSRDGDALNVLVCGGGKLAICVAAHCASRNMPTSVLTRSPQLWTDEIEATTTGSAWESRGTLRGRLANLTSRADRVVPEADVIIVCAPAHAHPDILRSIAPFLSTTKQQELGTVFAQGGFDLACKSVLGQEGMDRLRCVWGLQNVPYICTTKQRGHKGIIVGIKKKIYMAAHPVELRHEVAERVSALFEIPCQAVPNFLTLTLTPSNQIIHPARNYGAFRDFDGVKSYTKAELAERKSLTLYNDMDEFSAEHMAKLDNELQQIKLALLQRFPQLDLTYVMPISERITLQYGEMVTDTSSLRKIFQTNAGYSGLGTAIVESSPGRFQPNVNGRHFWEDIPFGLCILKNLAEMLGNFPTPSIDFTIRWHQQFMGKEYLLPDGQLNPSLLGETGAPNRYGIHNPFDLVRTSLPREMLDYSYPTTRSRL